MYLMVSDGTVSEAGYRQLQLLQTGSLMRGEACTVVTVDEIIKLPLPHYPIRL